MTNNNRFSTPAASAVNLKNRHRFLLLLLVLFLPGAHCQAQSALDPLAVSTILFSESSTLPLFTSYPPLAATELNVLKSSLTTAFRATGPDCSFIDRALAADDLSGFRRLDLNHDGHPDIVYSGSAHCAEGDGTVIWMGSADGYTLSEPEIWPFLLLRVTPDGAKTISVAGGCCGAFTDTYASGNIDNFRRNGELPILKETRLPLRVSRPQSFTHAQTLKLRSAPVAHDTYNEGKSYLLGHATFGNVVRTYMPGASGRVLGQSKDKRWVFVVMDPASDALVLQDPYHGVRAGWLPANKIRPKPLK